jgi:hypothetical protein
LNSIEFDFFYLIQPPPPSSVAVVHTLVPQPPLFGPATWHGYTTPPEPAGLRPLPVGRCQPVGAAHPPPPPSLSPRLPCGTIPLTVPNLRALVQDVRAVTPPLLFPLPHRRLQDRASIPPLPTAFHPLRPTGDPSSRWILATVPPLTRPPGELCPRHHCPPLEPRLAFPLPSSSCRATRTSSPATRASPSLECHCLTIDDPFLVSSVPCDHAQHLPGAPSVLTGNTSSPAKHRPVDWSAGVLGIVSGVLFLGSSSLAQLC